MTVEAALEGTAFSEPALPSAATTSTWAPIPWHLTEHTDADTAKAMVTHKACGVEVAHKQTYFPPARLRTSFAASPLTG
jgi:hypothetical protein